MGNDSSKPGDGGTLDKIEEELGHMGEHMKTQVGRIKAIVGGKAREERRAPTGSKTSPNDYTFLLVSMPCLAPCRSALRPV